ncbi:MAG: choice-of-anchor tandem repeat GloVer-containing protein [Bacteroidota bacterium]
MKKNLLKTLAFGIVLFSITQAKAQIKLWGMTYQGTEDGYGGIFNYSPSTGANNVDYTFKTFYNGSNPVYDKVVEVNGKIYGTTNSSGTNGNGVLYQYDLATGIYTVIQNFNYDNGAYPEGGLMIASNGKIYGCTTSYGNNYNGTLFELDPTTLVYTVKYHFNNTSGTYVKARLIEGATDVLFGITNNGGDNGTGTIFEYNIATNTLTVKHDFNGTDGYSENGLVKATNGNFYGLTRNNNGKLFEYNTTLSSYTVLYDFSSNASNGIYPEGSLIQASNGKLYGVAGVGGSNSGGVVFEYDITATSYTVIHNFDGATGNSPKSGELVEASTGKLLGLTQFGGDNGNGVLFELEYATSSYTVKHHFNNSQDGYEAHSSLYKAANGKYYATTRYGAASGSGAFFEYDYATNTCATKFSFNSQPEGKYANGSLTKQTNGKMYGMNSDGGTNGGGVIFEFDPVSKNYAVKYNFNEDDDSGYQPYGSLVQANNGLLYGTTYYGGTNNEGVLFQFNPATTSYTVLHSFEYATGSYPFYYGSLATTGNLLYGTAYDGGDNGDGVIYKYDLATSSYTVIHHFNSSIDEGYEPYSSVTIANNGKLYGTTYYGGVDGYGTVYEFDPTAAGSFTTLHSFDDNDGSNPYAGVIEVSAGKFAGTTYDGGLYGDGVIFEFDVNLSSYTVKYNFEDVNNGNGYNSYGDLYKAADGMLYGMTEYGGYNGDGVLYQYNPTTGDYSKKMSFNGENGENAYGSLIETCETPTPYSIAEQTKCDNATVADLIAFGSNLKWYNSTGSVLAPSTALVNGDKYYVSQTIGCESASKFEITYTCTVGMEEATNTTFGVYPNPNNGVFTIVSENSNTTFTITDITGKLVKTGTISANKTEVNLNEVTTGIYFLKVDNKVSKIVKQ